jgi:hypothetical protein
VAVAGVDIAANGAGAAVLAADSAIACGVAAVLAGGGARGADVPA